MKQIKLKGINICTSIFKYMHQYLYTEILHVLKEQSVLLKLTETCHMCIIITLSWREILAFSFLMVWVGLVLVHHLLALKGILIGIWGERV